VTVAGASPYPLLLSPLQLGPVELRNRIVLSPMTTGFGFDQGVPDDALLAYFGARSGGVGMVTVAFGAVTPEGRVEERLPWMWRDDIADRLRPLVSVVQERGARVCLQLGHGGRQVSPVVTGQTPVAPSPVPPPVHVKEPPHELFVTEIEAIVDAFGRGASRAAEAGFDAIELHAGHGYLVHQFLSAGANLREDEYGGTTLAARARFGVDVVGTLKREAPGLALVVRMNGTDITPGGMEPDDAAVVARLFVAAGADGLVISAGVYGSVPYTIPLLDDEEASHVGSAAFVRRRLREHGLEVPVLTVGGIERPAVAEAALRRGDCDAVVVGRALIADPEWGEKAAAGRAADIRPCIGLVDACAGMLATGDPIGCAVNPEVGRESRGRPVAARRARVVVVGAGPAGLEAACSAAEAGHDVVLLEREERVGGALGLAGRTPTLARLRRLLAWYERRVAASGVEVRRGVEATAGDVAELEPEVVVVAVGATTEPPVLDGYDALATWTIEDLLDGRPSTLGSIVAPSRPVVVGSGRQALAGALACSHGGADVSLLSRERPGFDASGLVRRAYMHRLDREGVLILRGRPVALRPDGVRWADENGEESVVAADGVVLAGDRAPVRLPGLERLAVDVAVVGDAREPRDIASATAEGREAIDAFTRGL
jgi:2,4-dienoyl-CoA reductase-like NADH-dependent reductase (Old Yellow Enzyme family)/thioredoxin reductase